jgi:hypothetical protein
VGRLEEERGRRDAEERLQRERELVWQMVLHEKDAQLAEVRPRRVGAFVLL